MLHKKTRGYFSSAFTNQIWIKFSQFYAEKVYSFCNEYERPFHLSLFLLVFKQFEVSWFNFNKEYFRTNFQYYENDQFKVLALEEWPEYIIQVVFFSSLGINLILLLMLSIRMVLFCCEIQVRNLAWISFLFKIYYYLFYIPSIFSSLCVSSSLTALVVVNISFTFAICNFPLTFSALIHSIDFDFYYITKDFLAKRNPQSQFLVAVLEGISLFIVKYSPGYVTPYIGLAFNCLKLSYLYLRFPYQTIRIQQIEFSLTTLNICLSCGFALSGIFQQDLDFLLIFLCTTSLSYFAGKSIFEVTYLRKIDKAEQILKNTLQSERTPRQLENIDVYLRYLYSNIDCKLQGYIQSQYSINLETLIAEHQTSCELYPNCFCRDNMEAKEVSRLEFIDEATRKQYLLHFIQQTYLGEMKNMKKKFNTFFISYLVFLISCLKNQTVSFREILLIRDAIYHNSSMDEKLKINLLFDIASKEFQFDFNNKTNLKGDSIIEVILFDESLEKCLQTYKKCLDLKNNFLTSISSDSIDIHSLQKHALSFHKKRDCLLGELRKLFLINCQNPDLFDMCGGFEKCLYIDDIFTKLYRRIDCLGKKLNKLTHYSSDSTAIYISLMTQIGRITKVSRNFQQIVPICQNRVEIIGKNINALQVEEMSLMHDEILKKYLSKKQMNKDTKDLPFIIGKDQHGWAIAYNLKVQLCMLDHDELGACGWMKRINNGNMNLMTSTEKRNYQIFIVDLKFFEEIFEGAISQSDLKKIHLGNLIPLMKIMLQQQQQSQDNNSGLLETLLIKPSSLHQAMTSKDIADSNLPNDMLNMEIYQIRLQVFQIKNEFFEGLQIKIYSLKQLKEKEQKKQAIKNFKNSIKQILGLDKYHGKIGEDFNQIRTMYEHKLIGEKRKMSIDHSFTVEQYFGSSDIPLTETKIENNQNSVLTQHMNYENNQNAKNEMQFQKGKTAAKRFSDKIPSDNNIKELLTDLPMSSVKKPLSNQLIISQESQNRFTIEDNSQCLAKSKILVEEQNSHCTGKAKSILDDHTHRSINPFDVDNLTKKNSLFPSEGALSYDTKNLNNPLKTNKQIQQKCQILQPAPFKDNQMNILLLSSEVGLSPTSQMSRQETDHLFQMDSLRNPKKEEAFLIKKNQQFLKFPGKTEYSLSKESKEKHTQLVDSQMTSSESNKARNLEAKTNQLFGDQRKEGSVRASSGVKEATKHEIVRLICQREHQNGMKIMNFLGIVSILIICMLNIASFLVQYIETLDQQDNVMVLEWSYQVKKYTDLFFWQSCINKSIFNNFYTFDSTASKMAFIQQTTSKSKYFLLTFNGFLRNTVQSKYNSIYLFKMINQYPLEAYIVNSQSPSLDLTPYQSVLSYEVQSYLLYAYKFLSGEDPLFLSEKRAYANSKTVFAGLDFVYNQNLSHFNNLLSLRRLLLTLQLVIILIVTGILSTFILPIFVYSQKKLEEILRLFACIPAEKIISMKAAVELQIEKMDLINHSKSIFASSLTKSNTLNFQRSKFFLPTDQPLQLKETFQNKQLFFANIKRKNISQTNNLPRITKKLIAGIAVCCACSAFYPFVQYFTGISSIDDFSLSLDFMSSMDQFFDNITLLMISKFQSSYSAKVKGVNYINNDEIIPSMKQTALKTNTLLEQLTTSLHKYNTYSGYYASYFETYLIPLFEQNVCQTYVNGFTEFEKGMKLPLGECFVTLNGILTKGILVSVQKYMQLLQKYMDALFNLDDASFLAALQDMEKDLDVVNEYNFVKVYFLTVRNLHSFFSDISNWRLIFDTQVSLALLIVSMMFLTIVYFLGWRRFYNQLGQDYFATKQLLDLVEANVLLDNPYIMSFFKCHK